MATGWVIRLLVWLYGYWFGYLVIGLVIDLVIWLLVWLYGYWDWLYGYGFGYMGTG